MAFALLLIGITLVVSAVRDTQGNLVSLISGDFTGPANFWYWIAALLAVGAIGYVPRVKPVSDGLIVLIVLALFLSKGNPKSAGGGFFQKFTEALSSTTKPAGTGTSSGINVVLPVISF